MMHPLRRILALLLVGLLPAAAWSLAPPRFPRPQPRSRPGANGVGDYEYETRYFRQRLDHFSFPGVGDEDEDEAAAFFQQRYLVGRGGGWAGPGGPIFFYCGNEGDIAWFAANSGLVWEAAPRFAALVVFAEHRYYGESMPFGSKAKAYSDSKSLAYLTAEQALADFAVLLTDLKRNLSAEGSPVVLFGGSYGGMLAAWMRLKYPHIAIGALASSAPILQFEDIVPSTIFYDLVSDDFRRESLSCFLTIKDSWKELDDQANEQDGLLKLSKTFHLCQTLKTSGDLSDWLSSAYSYLAMVDYPLPSEFLMPLPANPIKEVCRNIDSQPKGTGTLERIYAGVNVYYNYTGTVDCFDLNDDPHGMGGWDWQACTEMVMPMSYSEQRSMYPPYKFDYASYAEDCIKSYGVRPRPKWITTEFGGHNITKVLENFGSNIIFFNGLLDPWSGGGVLKNISESVVAIVAPLGAHHIDLRPATPDDPDWLVALRESELEIISGWLWDYYGAGGALFQPVAVKGSSSY
ncbi:Putative serine peptidase S28 family protein [Zea mays]|uniref:Putative serine peptidase S28 family protein n=1 Tax=Zea mays TaxID=4577 RepID=K7V4K2_MAIZE|nr:Putative serine peptidase S28 family protein [Zea mays]AQL00199.1 Putative serine peptidase S28 family protein [Zea mays]